MRKIAPPYALRLARYYRYADKAADAEVLSRTAIGLPTPRAIVERVLILLATDKGEEARALVAKDALILGPMASWVLAYIDAVGARAAEARGKARSSSPPDRDAPLLAHLTALAMADLGDKKRGTEMVRQLAKILPKNPDVIVASGALRR